MQHHGFAYNCVRLARDLYPLQSKTSYANPSPVQPAYPREDELRRIVSIICIAAVFATGLCISIRPALAQNRKANVLIIHSYHQGFMWTDSIDTSLDKTLADSGLSLHIFTEYMDSKRFFGEIHLRHLYDLYREKYSHVPIDVIVCTDDNAFTFLARYHDDLFADTPVVFCGVNNIHAMAAAENKYFTGVLEMIDIHSTLQIALRLQPATRQIAVIVDRTPTGENTSHMLYQAIPSFRDVSFRYFDDNISFSELMDEVEHLPPDSIAFLLNYNRDGKGQVYSHMETVNALQAHCPVPIYAVWDFFLGKGILGGMLASGTLQGETAARMALKILKGRSPWELPVIMDSPNQFMFDYTQLDRFGIDVSDLPENAIVINAPLSFYSVNKQLIWSLVSALAFFGGMTVFLTLTFLKRKAAERFSNRLNRSLMTLSHCNQSLIRANNEPELLREICRVIVETGSYLLCWVGYANDDGTGLIPQAIWTAENGEVSSGVIDWCNNSLDVGINGQAYRSGQPTVVQDIRNDPVYRPWRKEALKRGFASTIALPLGSGNQSFGVLRIYSPEVDGFDPEEVGLLTWLADNLAYGIVSQHISVERRQALKELRRSTEQLSMLLKALPIVPYTGEADSTFRLTYIGNAIRDVIGYSASAFLDASRCFEAHIHPDDLQRVHQWSNSTETDEIRKINYRFKTAGGSYRWICDTRRIVKNPQTNSIRVVGMWQDITEEIKLRQDADERLQQVIQADKLASLGEVVAGVAHEINNPNSFISYNIPLLAETWHVFRPIIESWDDSHPDWQKNGMHLSEYCQDMDGMIHDINTGCQRINRVVSDLKDFARLDNGVEIGPLDLNEGIQKAMTIIGPQVRRSIKQVELDLSSDLPPIHGRLIKIEQIITNLVVNATHAMDRERQGHLRIRTRHIPRLNCVNLQVEDNGIGIGTDIVDRIFEPFFTQRRDAGGTGLGLSVCYRLVQEHHGALTVTSRPGTGTCFNVFLPVSPDHPAEIKSSLLYIGSAANREPIDIALQDTSYQLSNFSGDVAALEEKLIDFPEIQALVIDETFLHTPAQRRDLSNLQNRFPLKGLILIIDNGNRDVNLPPDIRFDTILTCGFFGKDLLDALTAMVHRSL